jgi:isopenicillin N synthase-like dioxygenase
MPRRLPGREYSAVLTIGSLGIIRDRFFRQPIEEKLKVVSTKSQYHNGYSVRRSAQVSPSESVDNKEGFMWRYDPKFDSEKKDLSAVPEEVLAWLRGEDFVWEGTSHIPNFQEYTITYWRACLSLARALVKVFAVCQDLPEEYFDQLTTYPGADGVYNYYPAVTQDEPAKAGPRDVGLGSHTDLQCFTLLWQDQVGGLQVLNHEGQWMKANPIPGTFVVNIGDFLMRLTNDKFKSTVHRVYNRTSVDRLSMPFFFGFNFNEKCSVLPTCTDEKNPPKYEPISCGEVCSPC